MIHNKRVYEPGAKNDGKRFLVDRLWPRGVKKEALALDGWLKEVAPSDALRRWFNHDAAKWKEFQRRYRAELSDKPENWQPLLEAAKAGDVTLLFGAHDTEHNNAMVLKALLEERLGTGSYVYGDNGTTACTR
jgi:uncharacterized protein YeaO (DUF488 family)